MRKRKYISDINVTPFVDVLLVLLVVFMVTMPMVIGQVPVSLPKTKGLVKVTNKKPVFVSMTMDGRIFVQDKQIGAVSEIGRELKAINVENNETIYLRGDKSIQYGVMMNLMNDLTVLGYSVSLVTEDK